MTSGRRFVWNGRIVRFDFDSFDRGFRREATLRAASLSQYETLLAQRLNVDSTTVHSWRMRRSGPSCLDVIHLLCSEWGIDMEGMLAMDKRVQEEKRIPLCMDGLRDPQVDAIGRFYAEVIDYLDDFERTMGFNDYWFDFADSGVKPEHIEFRLYDLCEAKLRKVEHALKRERFLLAGTGLYDALEEYVWEDLCDIFNGKLSFAYRFEAPVDGNPSTGDDYDKALSRLHAILGMS